MSRHFILTFGLLLWALSSLQAQAPIRYSVGLGNIQHHELRIAVDFPALPDRPVTVRMPNTSPGRYAEHNFAKNVYDVQAYDGEGRPISVYRTDIDTWVMTGHDGRGRFVYTLYANHGDGTYSGIDNRKLHLNMPSAFVYAEGLDGRPVELSFDLSRHPEWKVATQMVEQPDGSFRAPDYYYFYDSPTLVGDIDFRRWTVTDNGREYTIEVAMDHEGTDEQLDDYAEWVKKVVEQQQQIWGELPDFDYGRYTFLCAYNPWVFGDGMEHRNSTICSSTGSLADNAARLIGTVSHEFMHAWNVERLRPATLEPFDFHRANMSDELWFAEGFTSYYDDIALLRAGIRSPQDYADNLQGLFNYVLLRPGSRLRSPVEMSRMAPFVDAASSIDEDNFANTFISYYPYGEVLGLALDLSLRSRFDTLTLDHYMRALYREYGRTEVPYFIPDLKRVLSELTRDEEFTASFFGRYIEGRELPDMASLLRPYGFEVAPARGDTVGFYGLRLREDGEELQVDGTIYRNNPLYVTGLEKGDHILQLNGRPVATQAAWEEAVSRLETGQVYSLTYRQNGREITEEFTARPDPRLSVKLSENPSDEMLARRRAWLGREE